MASQKPTAQSTEVPNLVNPHLFADPNKIRNPELYKYTSIDTLRIQQSFKNYKRSSLYILGILGGCAVASIIVNKCVQHYIFGSAGNGGDFLRMYTKNTTDDYYYNREFQRMRYLTEEPVGDDKTLETKPEMLADLKMGRNPRGNNKNVVKKAPHYKYF